eukprot:g4675.t1
MAQAAAWLVAICDQHLALAAAANNDAGCWTGGTTLAQEIYKVFQSSNEEGQLQTDLFNLLGVAGFDTIAELLKKKDLISSITKDALNAVIRAEEQSQYEERAPVRNPNTNNFSSTTNQLAGMRINSESEKRAEREYRKEQRRIGRQKQSSRNQNDGTFAGVMSSLGFEKDYISQEHMLGLRGTDQRRDQGKSIRQRLGLGKAYIGEERRTGLPPGTVRVQLKGYELVKVPAVKSRKNELERPPVKISSLPEWAQLAFPRTKRLNKLQSALYPVAFETNENMLVCAPTGAGKTNVAMLTVLRTFSQHLKDGVIQRDDFKIIYVAPMKALAQEVVTKFGQRLRGLGIKVSELTGDMQMTRQEVDETQIIVTTPEKWDVITRKSGDGSLIEKVRLLIIDEVHLLASDRGAVIEVLVARMLRRVESAQSMIRLVGLSATLPNYMDVAHFLRVNPEPGKGLFYADDSFRPVPLSSQYAGVTEKKNIQKKRQLMNVVAYEKVIEALQQGHQVLVFVHSRKDTANTARAIRDMALRYGTTDLFSAMYSCTGNFNQLAAQAAKARDKILRELFGSGIACHHAGMLRPDRSLAERLFDKGAVKVLCCTATLAWGVNLPAHTVVIKGTQIYNAEKGDFTDMDILDVQQIFGRAGRPQYDTSGEGIIITTHDKLDYYLRLMTHQLPIESQFIQALPDHLNAEIVAGTVTNIDEAVEWLSYTYLFVRMLRNPMVYGIGYEEKEVDPLLLIRRKKLAESAAKILDRCRMIRFDLKSGNLGVTDMGRVASHFYISYQTIETFNECLHPHMTDSETLNAVALASEFDQLKIRDEEVKELELMSKMMPVAVRGGIENSKGKANLLLQAHISGRRPVAFTLCSDANYVSKNSGRIARGLFEICMKRGWSFMAAKMLKLCKSIDHQVWAHQTPLRQFRLLRGKREVLGKVEARRLSIGKLRDDDFTAKEIGQIVRENKMGATLKKYARQIPQIHIEYAIRPITRTILQVTLTIIPDFDWNDKMHGQSEYWYIWVEDGDNTHIYHVEEFILKKHDLKDEPRRLNFTIPIFEPLPAQYYVRAISNHWVGSETEVAMSFKHLILPRRHPPHTELIATLKPLPVAALKNEKYEALYDKKFLHWNPVQTQFFHVVYHTDKNVLLGAPTGSGKTVAAELSIMRMFDAHPGQKAVYIGPLKALVRERLADWKKKFGGMGRKVEELTGDHTPDRRALREADILIATPEKWDSISRSWQRRGYVQKVGLVIIDEIHLLGADRGPVLEVIVSRMRYIGAHAGRLVRLVGLSTALANAQDLADWLGVDRVGLFNFKPSVRPVPLEAHVMGFPGKAYCPRMATMNKPTYAAIRVHSPSKPVLVFVASRRQTRLTALELIALASADDARQFVGKGDETLVSAAAAQCRDDALRQTLPFGIGIHHAGLSKDDRKIVEDLFLNNHIQVLCCTSTLAWGVNFPAHLVVVKGTEYFDGKLGRYVDFPITDVLQMMGRAGRPQFDDHGVAVILIHAPKKNFYRRFLYEPFPVESSLKDSLAEHINAEIASGTIRSRSDAADYLTWTYLFRRLLQNPTYYDLEEADAKGAQRYLFNLVDDALSKLEASGCCELNEEDKLDVFGSKKESTRTNVAVQPTTLGLIASYYYISHRSVGLFDENLENYDSVPKLAQLLASAFEFEELPVRHNEENLNAELAESCPWEVDETNFDPKYETTFFSPHTKAFLLIQAHLKRLPLPIADYTNDTRSMLDQSMRVLNAMVDIAADNGLFQQALHLMKLSQMLVQARMDSDSSLLQLPNVGASEARKLSSKGVVSIRQLIEVEPKALKNLLHQVGIQKSKVNSVCHAVEGFPNISMQWSLEHKKKEAKGFGKSSYSPSDTTSDAYNVVVEHGDECELKVSLKVMNADKVRKFVHAPKWKGKNEIRWWLVLGSGDELLALKRVNVYNNGKEETATLLFEPPDFGKGKISLQLCLVPDTVLGLELFSSIPIELLDDSWD